jgi:cobalt-zinc-cadmium efflux system membrane fusion protein
VLARVSVDNASRQWSPGLYVTTHVTLSESSAALAVAASALQTLDGVAVVFVKTAAGFDPRALRTGRADGRFVEVLDGLVAGEVYAARNSFIVKAELGKGSAAHAD